MTQPRLLIIDEDLERGKRLASLAGEQRLATWGPATTAAEWPPAGPDQTDVVVAGVPGPKDRLDALLTTVREASARALPVLVVLSAGAPDTIQACLDAGADDYLIEPFDGPALALRAHACIGRQQLANEAVEAKVLAARQAKLVDDLTTVILPIGAALSAEQNPDRLLERIVVEAKKVCNADAGTLYLCDEDQTLRFTIMHTNSLQIALGGTTGKPITQPAIPMYTKDGSPNEHNVATHVALRSCSVNIPDVYDAQGFDFSGTRTFDSRNGYRSKSCLAVPLINNVPEVIGVLQLINAQDPMTGEIIAFDSYAQQVVESLASLAAVAISNRRLIQQQEKLLKYERDVQIGRQIQSDFLPQHLPQLANWEIAACFRPAREVSGDFYDVFELPGGRHVGFVIADISDKGVPAALFMALIRSLLHAFSEIPVPSSLLGLAERYGLSSSGTDNLRLATLLTHLNAVNAVLLTNNYLVRNHSEANMFATLFCGVVDTETGLVTYVNCGHEPLVIIDNGGVKGRLGPTGPAVGLFEDMALDIERFVLEPGDLLFAYTDGVTDARSPEGAFFSAKGLLALLENCSETNPDITARDVVNRVDGALTKHIGIAAQFDDITMLAIRRGTNPQQAPADAGA